MNIGLCFLINLYLLVQKSNSEPDTYLHLHVDHRPPEQGRKVIFHLQLNTWPCQTVWVAGITFDIRFVVLCIYLSTITIILYKGQPRILFKPLFKHQDPGSIMDSTIKRQTLGSRKKKMEPLRYHQVLKPQWMRLKVSLSLTLSTINLFR